MVLPAENFSSIVRILIAGLEDKSISIDHIESEPDSEHPFTFKATSLQLFGQICLAIAADATATILFRLIHPRPPGIGFVSYAVLNLVLNFLVARHFAKFFFGARHIIFVTFIIKAIPFDIGFFWTISASVISALHLRQRFTKRSSRTENLETQALKIVEPHQSPDTFSLTAGVAPSGSGRVGWAFRNTPWSTKTENLEFREHVTHSELCEHFKPASHTRPIRVLAIDDDNRSFDKRSFVRSGIAKLVNSQKDMLLVAEATTGQDGVERFRNERPDVTVLNENISELSGVEFAAIIRAEFPDARIILVSPTKTDLDIEIARASGVDGYVSVRMTDSSLIFAIRCVNAGIQFFLPRMEEELPELGTNSHLTDREWEVLRRIADGTMDQDIAQNLISEEAVKNHLDHIMGKLGVSDRGEAIMIGLRRGFV